MGHTYSNNLYHIIFSFVIRLSLIEGLTGRGWNEM